MRFDDAPGWVEVDEGSAYIVPSLRAIREEEDLVAWGVWAWEN